MKRYTNLILSRTFPVELMRKISESFFRAQNVSIVIDVFQFNIRLKTVLLFKVRSRSIKTISSTKFIVIAKKKKAWMKSRMNLKMER